MSAKEPNDGAQRGSVGERAIEVIETVGRGYRILFNDRVQPLTVTRMSGPYEGRSGCDWIELEGPQGGRYKLVHTTRYGECIELRRETGYDDNGMPEYDEIKLNRIEIVDQHEFVVGQVIEVSDPVFDQYFHVVTDIPDSGCYDVETVGVRVNDGEVADTKETGLFSTHSKEKIFDGRLEVVDRLELWNGGGTGTHYDTEREEEVRLSDPHRRGVDLRPTDGHGLEVVKWETILFGFEERFQTDCQEGDEPRSRLVTDGGVVENAGEDSRQVSITAATSDRPTTGVPIDERTHYGHVRYSASEHPGTIWYDPRDGREKLSLDVDTSLSALDLDERVLSSVRLHGKRNVCGVVDPSEDWVLELNYAEKVEYEPIKDTDETAFHVESYRKTEVYDSQEAARDAAAEQVEEYTEADWRNAVEFSNGGADE